MRVLYVAPRYHTNQIPVMKGWLKNGHQVMFISQFKSTPEDYHILKPIILGYSKAIEKLIYFLAKAVYRKKYTVEKEYALKIKIGLPPVKKMKQYLNSFRPDAVIVRERSLYNIPFYRFCRKRNIPCILYNQSPVWDSPDRDSGIGHRVLIHFLPQYRMTPVLGSQGPDKVKMVNSTYVPFVIEPRINPEEKIHFRDGKVQILCVARYEERKNLFMLLDVIHELADSYGISLTIIGEATDEPQCQYYRKLQETVQRYGLEERVSLLKNLNMEQMYQEYAGADLFVLPSTRERASISQLEAMSCSIPVICSDTNGTACYIEPDKNGYVFRDMDSGDLKEKIEKVISDKEKLLYMGECSYNEVVVKYQFSNYFQNILDMIRKAERGDKDDEC